MWTVELPMLLPRKNGEVVPAPNRSLPGYQYVIGSSDLGRCIKASVAELLDYEPMAPSESMQLLYNSGHDHEATCLTMMEADGWTLTGKQSEHVIGGPVAVIVHPDAIGEHPDLPGSRVIEVKKPITWAKFEQAVRTQTFTDPYMHRIAWQVSCQMHATGLEAYVTCWSEEDGVRGFGIEVPPFTMQDIEDRVASIALYVDANQLPNVCTSNDYPCPFLYLHEAPEYEDDPVLDQMVAEYEVHGDTMRAAKAAQDAVKQRIKAHVAGREKVETAGSVVSVYEQASPKKYDMDAIEEVMQANHQSIGDYLYKQTTSTRMKITVRSDDE